MGGIGDEVPLGLEGFVKSGEQAVDGVGEVLHLVVRSGEGKPFMEVSFGDLLGCGRHRPQRTEHPPRHEPAENDSQHRHDAERDGGLRDELVEVVGVLGGCLRGELTGDLQLFGRGSAGLELRTVRRRAELPRSRPRRALRSCRRTARSRWSDLPARR